MSNIRHTFIRITVFLVVVIVAAAILSGPGIAQTNNERVVTRNFPIPVRATDTPAQASDTPLQPMAVTIPPLPTPTVRPAITRDIDNPTRQVILPNWTVDAWGLGDGGGGCNSGFPTLPDGARIIIEKISVKLVSPTALTGAYVAVYTTKHGFAGDDEEGTAAIQIPLQSQGIHYSTQLKIPNAYHYVGNAQVRLQIVKDDWFCEREYPSPTFVNAFAHYSYFGYILAP